MLTLAEAQVDVSACTERHPRAAAEKEFRLRLIRGMQHDPQACDNVSVTASMTPLCLLRHTIYSWSTSISDEEPRHVFIVGGQAVHPRAKLCVQFAVLSLPLFNIRERSNVYWLLQKEVYLGEYANDFDVVAKAADILRSIHHVVVAMGRLEPPSVDGLVLRKEVVSTWLRTASTGARTRDLAIRWLTSLRSISFSSRANSNAVATVAYLSSKNTIQNSRLLLSSSMKLCGSGSTIARRVYIDGYRGATDADVVSTARPSWTTLLVINARRFHPGGPLEVPTISRASITWIRCCGQLE